MSILFKENLFAIVHVFCSTKTNAFFRIMQPRQACEEGVIRTEVPPESSEPLLPEDAVTCV